MTVIKWIVIGFGLALLFEMLILAVLFTAYIIYNSYYEFLENRKEVKKKIAKLQMDSKMPKHKRKNNI